MSIQQDTLEIQEIAVDGFEKVYRVEDPSVGLKGFICLHNLTLGPALGGIRLFPYQTEEEALTDVKRLAGAMSYKSAVIQAGLGGGKSVIMADPKNKTEELLFSFGRAIEKLGGIYIGAEDVGTTPQDLLVIQKATRYVVGLPLAKSSGNPSSFTAWGAYRGIQASLQHVFGSSSVHGRVVAIQGVGSVGTFLADMLFWNGAKLIVTDVHEGRAKELAKRYGASYCKPEEIYAASCDVFAPCALGGILSPEVVQQLSCKIVAGAANNQLLTPQEGIALAQRNILYAPDFVINAGGLINVTDELMPDGYNPTRAREKINQIYDQLLVIFTEAKEKGISTHDAATALGDHFLKNKIGARSAPLHFHHFE